MCRFKSKQGVPVNSVSVATMRVRRLAEMETRGFGDDANALRRLEAMTGIGYWTLHYLRLGKAKTISADLAENIRQAYLTYVSGKVATFQAELAEEKAREDDGDAALSVLLDEAEELAQKITAAKKRLTARGRA